MKKRKINKIYILIIISIIFFTFLIINYIGKKITPIVNNLVIKIVNKNIYRYIFNTFNKDIMTNVDVNDIVYFTLNDEGEIIAIDYRFDKAYNVLSDALNNLYLNVENIEIDSLYYDKRKQVFFVPMGIISNNVLLSNMGSKIPCKVKFLSDIQMGFKTKVSNYGVNNVLVELYVVIETKNDLINSMNAVEFGESKEVVIASKVVMGSVPGIYGGQIEKFSSIVSS